MAPALVLDRFLVTRGGESRRRLARGVRERALMREQERRTAWGSPGRCACEMVLLQQRIDELRAASDALQSRYGLELDAESLVHLSQKGDDREG